MRPPFVLALAAAAFSWWALQPQVATAPQPVIAAPSAPPPIVDTLRSNQTLSDVWSEHGLDYGDLQAVVAAGRSLHSWRQLRPGTVYEFSFLPSGVLRQVALTLDRDRSLVFRRRVGAFEGELIETHFRRDWHAFSTCVEGSLWGALSESGEDPGLAVTMAEILGGQLDFYTDLHPGDCLAATITADFRPDGSYRVVSLDGLRLELKTKSRTYEAYRFAADGERFDYYDTDGQSLKRRFLRSPLKFTRISSGFGMRVHPITHRWKEHRGVDYVAPTGTPVQAAGDGAVRRSGRHGGYGLHVELAHGKRYVTSYSHLSRIARGIRPGASVHQGQIIGYVGSTGMATGSHLHYRFVKDGRDVNPLSTDLPTAVPLDGQALERFLQERDELRRRIGDPSSPLPLAHDSPGEVPALGR